MGECFIVRRGGQTYQLPVLNEAYPQDVTVVASASGSASFTVQISQPGTPAEYTYKWYQNGSAIADATGSSVTLTGLTEAASHTVYCEVTNKAGTVTSRVATLTVQDWLPVYAYTGNASLLNDGSYNWRIKFLTSGVLNFSSLGNGADGIDVFLVGGGAGSSHKSGSNYCGGGGGGYTTTQTGIVVSEGTAYTIVVGAGGAAYVGNGTGGTSSAFNVSANGGNTASGSHYANGGSGGSGGGGGAWTSLVNGGGGGHNGGSGGQGLGSEGNGAGGAGQGTTTREFGESTGDLYAGGGGGSGSNYGAGGSGGGGSNSAGTTNLGGGGSGNYQGGSGIVIIRNHR